MKKKIGPSRLTSIRLLLLAVVLISFCSASVLSDPTQGGPQSTKSSTLGNNRLSHACGGGWGHSAGSTFAVSLVLRPRFPVSGLRAKDCPNLMAWSEEVRSQRKKTRAREAYFTLC